MGQTIQIGLYLAAAVLAGGLVGWLLRGVASSRNLAQFGEGWQTRFDAATRLKDKLHGENTNLKTSLESTQTLVLKHKQVADASRTEIASLREKTGTLQKSLFTLRVERDELNNKLTRSHNLVNAAKKQLTDQQAEIAKAIAFYKEQLDTAVDQRTTLERKVDDAKSDNASLRNLLMATKAEHESVSKLLASSRARLQNLEDMEQKVVAIEAENAELRQQLTFATRKAESLQRDMVEIDDLKAQNRELAHCLESMESSRKQYEEDARRYRNQYERTEKESETLRFKLGDLEKNWAEMRRTDGESRKANHKQLDALPPFGLEAPQGEPDDLKQIVGIGKVFEETLHSLGVYHFRQIAAFGPAELARVNSELKEFKGRIEHDDWIGQARDLHFKKYGKPDAP